MRLARRIFVRTSIVRSCAFRRTQRVPLKAGHYHAEVEMLQGAVHNSADDKILLVQKGPVLGPHLYSPIARALVGHPVAAVRAVSAALIRTDAQVDRLIEAIASIPTMHHGGVHRRLEARVERERSGTNWLFGGGALPVSAAGPESLAKLCRLEDRLR